MYYSSHLATYTNKSPYSYYFDSVIELKNKLKDNNFPLNEFAIYENNIELKDFSAEKGEHEVKLVSPCMAYKFKYEIK